MSVQVFASHAYSTAMQMRSREEGVCLKHEKETQHALVKLGRQVGGSVSVGTVQKMLNEHTPMNHSCYQCFKEILEKASNTAFAHVMPPFAPPLIWYIDAAYVMFGRTGIIAQQPLEFWIWRNFQDPINSAEAIQFLVDAITRGVTRE